MQITCHLERVMHGNAWAAFALITDPLHFPATAGDYHPVAPPVLSSGASEP